ncbi:MAG: DUF6184 family natural product biosynthesis lipoprotein [Verrucomicrobiota bacterium]
MRDSRKWSPLALSVIVGALLCGAACSDDPLTQPQARDNAAGAVCDKQASCGQVGAAGAAFANRDACLTTWKGYIQGIWPPAECTRIVRAEYDMCIVSIQNAACGSGLDVVASLAKCAKVNVCGTP